MINRLEVQGFYFTYIQTALRAAKYHENLAFHFAHPKRSKHDYVVFHLRAYYWELTSIWHYILQEANSQTINIELTEVRGRFLDKIEKELPNYEYLKNLRKIKNNKWLKRIKNVRDHSHKWQINPYQVEINGDLVKVITIDNLDGKDNGLERQVNIDRNDFWFMEKSVNELADNGFFGTTVRSPKS